MMGGTRSDDVYGTTAAETQMLRCCFDKRVWAGLGVLAAMLLLADPRLGWTALPVLAGLACPVSMLVMMRGMARGRTGASEPPDQGRAAELARLRREIEQLKQNARR
jgi:hypothetical protein